MSKTKEIKTTRATGAKHIRVIRLLIPDHPCRAHLVSSYIVLKLFPSTGLSMASSQMRPWAKDPVGLNEFTATRFSVI